MQLVLQQNGETSCRKNQCNSALVTVVQDPKFLLCSQITKQVYEQSFVLLKHVPPMVTSWGGGLPYKSVGGDRRTF